MNRYIYICGIVGVMLLCYSCGVSRFIPEGERLYTGAELTLQSDTTIRGEKDIQEELESTIRPEPNGKFLGMRIGLWAHYKGSKEKPGFVNKFLKKKIGQEPVYFSQVDVQKTEALLLNRLENKGFYYTEVSTETEGDEKFARVKYTLHLTAPYLLEKYQMDGDSLPIHKDMQELMEETVLQPGQRFDLALLKQERERIDEGLKLNGYYNFNPDYLIFEADTNQYDERKFDLFLRLKGSAPKEGIVPYRVDQIRVFPNYAVDEVSSRQDTVEVAGMDFIQGQMAFKPELLENYILIEEGEKYNSEQARLTSNRLSSIGNYRYVNLHFSEKESEASTEERELDAHIYLSPMKKRSVRAELQGLSKSNNFIGPALNLNYQNRNLFKGGETLNITWKFAYETQVAGGDRTGLNSYELGLKTDLIFPRVIFPIPINERFSYSVPKTKISLGTEYLDRVKLYRLNSVSASYGYYWNANRFVYHEINPISMSLVNLTNTSEEFENILDSNPFLRQSFDQQFLAGINYTFHFSQLNESSRDHRFFVGTVLELAGNTLNLVDKTFGEETGRVFGLEYAQYARGEVDFRYHFKIDQNNTLAARLFGGVGLPYGNSQSLPFVKQFFTGGPNSVRAFRIRSLGPGTFRPETTGNRSFFEQSGDIKMEGNLEYRFPLVPYLKGAVFADAGNVWLINENEALPGGKFSADWLRQMGIGVGIGLRVDIEFFVIRFDLASPVRKPYLPAGERWDADFKLGQKSWRRENLIFNFAIGYPF